MPVIPLALEREDDQRQYGRCLSPGCDRGPAQPRAFRIQALALTMILAVVQLIQAAPAGSAAAGTDVVLPAVASGATASRPPTIVRVGNPADAPAVVTYTLLPAGGGTTVPLRLVETLLPHAERTYADAIRGLFGVAGGGAVRITSASVIVVSSWTTAPGVEAPGDPVAAVAVASAVGAGEETRVDGPLRKAAGREDRGTWGVVETAGAAAEIRVTPLDAAGRSLTAGAAFGVRPFEEEEFALDAPVDAVAARRAALRVEVLAGEGRIVAFARRDAFGPEESSPEDSAPAGAAGRPRRHLTRAERPSSAALIDRALAGGRIDGETALVYQVFAAFGDRRLPAEFRGDDSGAVDSLVMAEVRATYDTLSPQGQATLGPFLVPPIYSGSWMAAAGAPVGRVAGVSVLQGPPACGSIESDWSWVDTIAAPVRIWWQDRFPADASAARVLAWEVDARIWPGLTALLPRTPISDEQESCNGGNGRLDIYLVDGPQAITQPYRSCNPSPVYILAVRNIDKAVLAHELMHAFQYSYTLAGCLLDWTTYRWWAEATAEWTEDYIYPDDQHEHAQAPNFLADPTLSLDFPETPHAYGAYLLPFFMARKLAGPALIRQTWDRAQTMPALEAIDATVSGGFKDAWPEVVKFDWNQPPVADYQKLDGLKAGAMPTGGGFMEVEMQGRMDVAQPLAVDLPRLSATYKHFKFTDDNARTVAFWNGIGYKLDQREVNAAYGLQFVADDIPDEQKKGAHVWGLVKVKGHDWRVEDWTNTPYVTFCRDQASERLEELVIIFSNSEFKDRGYRLKPAGLAPILWVSNMGCWRWKGTAKSTGPDGEVVIDSAATWNLNGSQAPPEVELLAEGDETWTVSGTCTGHGNLPIPTSSSFLRLFPFTPAEGILHRLYYGAGPDIRTVNVTCPGPIETPLPLAVWFMTAMPVTLGGTGPVLQVSTDGTRMDGHFGVGWEFDWHFTAQREP